MASTFTVYHEFKRYLADGTVDLDGDNFVAFLSNSTPAAATETVRADITGIGETNGYAALTMTGVTWTETGAGTGVWRFDCADFAWTASAGSFGPFQYVILYDDTPAAPADPLVGYWDYGSSISITDGNEFSFVVGANGVFELS